MGCPKCSGRDLLRCILIQKWILGEQWQRSVQSFAPRQVNTAKAGKSPYCPCSLLVLREEPGRWCFYLSHMPTGISLEPAASPAHKPQPSDGAAAAPLKPTKGCARFGSDGAKSMYSLFP